MNKLITSLVCVMLGLRVLAQGAGGINGGTGGGTIAGGNSENGGGTSSSNNIIGGNNVTLTTNEGVVTIAVNSAPPNGAAGGALAGTYPNPTIATSILNTATSKGTNTATNYLAVYITGSVSVSAINGLYVQQSTNAGTGLGVYTNSLNNGKILAFNDPDIAPSAWALESMLGDENAYFTTSTRDFSQGQWTYNFGGGTSDVIVGMWGTNFISLTESVYTSTNIFPTNALNYNNISTVQVDPVLGDDTLALVTPTPYKTLLAACSSVRLLNGGLIDLAPGVYSEGIPFGGNLYQISIPNNVTLNGNGALFTNYVTFSAGNNDYIQDVLLPNGKFGTYVPYATNIVCKNMYIHASIDGLFMSQAGTLDFINDSFGSVWDSGVIESTTNWTLVRFYDCTFSSIATSNNNVNISGTHGLVWSPNGGGKLQIFGGSFISSQGTNIPYSGFQTLGNASLMIGNFLGSSGTVFGNATVEIYGTTFIHGTTNASASAAGVYNAANIPVTGYWTDVSLTNGNLFSSNIITSVQTYINTNTIPTNSQNSYTMGSFKLITGAGANKLLQSDASGNATWQTISTGQYPSNVYSLSAGISANSGLITMITTPNDSATHQYTFNAWETITGTPGAATIITSVVFTYTGSGSTTVTQQVASLNGAANNNTTQGSIVIAAVPNTTISYITSGGTTQGVGSLFSLNRNF